MLKGFTILKINMSMMRMHSFYSCSNLSEEIIGKTKDAVRISMSESGRTDQRDVLDRENDVIVNEYPGFTYQYVS